MYHPGIVLEILSSNDKNVVAVDKSMQAMLKMWDDNLITVLVDSKIGRKLRKNDIVLVDYRPIPNTSAPKLTVIKILKGNLAKTTWATYKKHLRRFKLNKDAKKAGKIPQVPAEQLYVG